jgi:large subunit ribosomal protein L25
MEQIALNVKERDTTGKGAARSLRRAESIPAVIYREGNASSLTIDRKEILTFIKNTGGEQVVVNLTYPDASTKMAIMKTYQVDPVRGELLHADFFEVSMTEKVKVKVHVTTVGEPVGVKRDKGVLQHGIREVEVQCLPGDIPGHLELDITELALGDSMHVSDIAAPSGVTILTDTGEMIVSVITPAVVEEAAPAEEEVEEEEEAAPEVAKKGKKEEEPAAEAEEEK